MGCWRSPQGGRLFYPLDNNDGMHLHRVRIGLAMRSMKPHNWQAIKPPNEGEATTFTLTINGQQEEGFAIRTHGALHAYINRCPHAGTPLDWLPGRFFSADGTVLICQTHGAIFAPDSGACLAGPCPHGLVALPVDEKEQHLSVPADLTMQT